MPGQLLIEYLERRHIEFTRQPHHVAYTAQDVARISDVNGHHFAKVVMIKVNGELAMMVLPAHYQVDLGMLQSALGADTLTLATEREFSYRFPRCELGAMPPFGHLFGLLTYLAPAFEGCKEIAFNAGTHRELIRMSFDDYLRMAYVIEVDECVMSSTFFEEPSRQRVNN